MTSNATALGQSADPTHFLDIHQTPVADLHAMLDQALAMKTARAGWPKAKVDTGAPLAGHALIMVFEKPSTRTRVSFDMAIRQLGGQSVVMNAGDMQLGRGESIADTARVLSGFGDAIMLRCSAHDDLLELAAQASVPVINALTDYSHPCQIMADLLTLREARGPLKGLKLAWLGDGNNVAMSFIHAANPFGFELRLACPKGFEAPEADIQAARALGAKIETTQDPRAAAEGADVLITDTWVSMGMEGSEARLAALSPYQVNAELMALAPGAHFLHCLPAHRGEEVSADVIDGPMSLVWQEAENRLHAQKAILRHCLGAKGIAE